MRGFRRGRSAIAVFLAITAVFVLIIPLSELEKGFGELRTAVPRVSRPPTQSCVVALSNHQGFSAGETPFLGNYSPPSGCLTPWSKVVLDLIGFVNGGQTDRVFAIWI